MGEGMECVFKGGVEWKLRGADGWSRWMWRGEMETTLFQQLKNKQIRKAFQAM